MEPRTQAGARAQARMHATAHFQNNEKKLGKLTALIDSGNSFGMCISAEAMKKLKFKIGDLTTDHLPRVQTASENAYLKILGKLPRSEGLTFRLGTANYKFPADIFVLDGLVMECNIGLDFLATNQCSVDFEKSILQVGGQTVRLFNPSTLQIIRPDIPRTLEVLPNQTIHVGCVGSIDFEEQEFIPRKKFKSETDNQEVHPSWRIQLLKRQNREPTVAITNCFTKKAKIEPNMSLGSMIQNDHHVDGDVDIVIENESEKLVNIRKLLKVQQQFEKKFLTKIEELFLKFYAVFSWDGSPGDTKLIKHRIPTGDARPIYRRPGPMNPEICKIVRKQIQKWLADKVIAKTGSVGSEYNSRLVIVPKKRQPGGPREYRVCADFRPLNNVTIKDKSPFAVGTIKETINRLSGARVFSVCDGQAGYHCISIETQDQLKTAFTFENCQYYFLKVPFGLCNAPACFGKLTEMALRNVPKELALPYLDDTIVFSASAEKHLQHLKLVLQAFLDAGIKLRPDKCYFFALSVVFLGFLITPEGVSVVPEYVNMIVNWPVPDCIHAARVFLGKTGYYAQFVNNYAEKARPLYDILAMKIGDKTPIELNGTKQEALEQAVHQIKYSLLNPPCLAYPCFDEGASKFILDTDFSDQMKTIGGCLSQEQPPGSGTERAIAFASKALRASMKNFSSYKGELYGIIYFINYFKYFLQFAPFILRVDCAALQWLRTQAQMPSGMIARWLEVLANHQFEVVHRPRKQHCNADGASRDPNASTISTSEDEAAIAPLLEPLCNCHLSTQELISVLKRQNENKTKKGRKRKRVRTKQPQEHTCQVCDQQFQSRNRYEYHFEQVHMNNQNSSFEDWLAKKNKDFKRFNNALANNFGIKQAKADIPDMIKGVTTPTNDPGTPKSITYSIKQWIMFQENDPVLGELKRILHTPSKPIKNSPMHPHLREMLKEKHLYSIDKKGLIRYQYFLDLPERHLVMVPTCLQDNILLYYHRSNGCANRDETIRRAKSHCYWIGMRISFESAKGRCEACNAKAKRPKPNKWELISHEYKYCWHSLSLDFVGPLQPRINNYCYLLTVKDVFSGWVEAKPIKAANSKEVTDFLAKELFVRFGVPKYLICDNGSQFTSKHMTDFCTILGIKLKHSSPFNPKSNMVERAHSDIKKKANSLLYQRPKPTLNSRKQKCNICYQILDSPRELEEHDSKQHSNVDGTTNLSNDELTHKEFEKYMEIEMAANDTSNWVEILPRLLWIMRTSFCRTRGASPYELMFARKPILSVDLLFGSELDEARYEGSKEDYLKARRQQALTAQMFAMNHVGLSIERQRESYTDTKRSFKENELVWCFTPTPVRDLSKKFQTYWSGPFIITKVISSVTYEIEQAPGFFNSKPLPKIVSIDRIKRYHEEEAAVTPPSDSLIKLDQGNEFLEMISRQQTTDNVSSPFTPINRDIPNINPWDAPNDIDSDEDSVEPPQTVNNTQDMKQLLDRPRPKKVTIPPPPEIEREPLPINTPTVSENNAPSEILNDTTEPNESVPIENVNDEQPPAKRPRKTNAELLLESTNQFFGNKDRPNYIDPAIAAQNLGIPNPDTQPRRRVTRSAQTDFNNRSRPVVQDHFRLDDPPILPDDTDQPNVTTANQPGTSQNLFTMAVASLDTIESENNQYFRHLVRNEPYYGLCPITCVTEHTNDNGKVTFEQQQVKREAYIDWMFNNQESQ